VSVGQGSVRESAVRRFFSPSKVVLGLLCVMYFITYVDRVNIGAAASSIQEEFKLSNGQLGIVFSAFAYPYLICQLVGGMFADKFGARKALVFCGLLWAGSTILTGFATSLTMLFASRLLLGLGEGATFPAATQAMQKWVPSEKRGLAQGLTHSFSRLANAVTPPMVAVLTLAFSWRGSFIMLGFVSLIWIAAWWVLFRDDPRDHPRVTPAELAALPPYVEKRKVKIPWGPLIKRMWPVTLTYFCYGWTLWLYINWLPSFFKNNFHLDISKSALFAGGVLFAGVVGDTLGGVLSDMILHRTGKLRLARLVLVIGGFTGAFLSLLPILYVRDVNTVALCLSAGFFFAELVVGPMWSIPMDVAPKHTGTAAGLMNIGSASAAIVSPIVAGYMIDFTHNWYLPFLVSMGILAVGAVCALLMNLGEPMQADEPFPAGAPA
jgi:MFS family permease